VPAPVDILKLLAHKERFVNVVEGDLHDPLCATYQTLEVARLNSVLIQLGVDEEDLRRRICETYFFDSGYFLDSCYLLEHGRKFQPGVHFSELDEKNEKTGVVLMPDPAIGTMFHEYAHGAAAWLFDDHAQDASEIETGDAHE
jgi:hypothetical protein